MLQCCLPSFYFRKIQNVVDYLQQVFAGGTEHSQVLFLFRVQRRRCQQFEHADYGVHGGVRISWLIPARAFLVVPSRLFSSTLMYLMMEQSRSDMAKIPKMLILTMKMLAFLDIRSADFRFASSSSNSAESPD